MCALRVAVAVCLCSEFDLSNAPGITACVEAFFMELGRTDAATSAGFVFQIKKSTNKQPLSAK